MTGGSVTPWAALRIRTRDRRSRAEYRDCIVRLPAHGASSRRRSNSDLNVNSFEICAKLDLRSWGRLVRVVQRQRVRTRCTAHNAISPGVRITIRNADDGSALGNPGPAGWARFADDTCWSAVGRKHATNNQAELTAVLQFFRATALLNNDLLILCDSQFVTK